MNEIIENDSEICIMIKSSAKRLQHMECIVILKQIVKQPRIKTISQAR